MSCFFNKMMIVSLSFFFISCGPGFFESLNVKSKKTKEGTQLTVSAELSLPDDIVLDEHTMTVTHPTTNAEVGTVQMSEHNITVNINASKMTGIPQDGFSPLGHSIDFGTPVQVISIPFETGHLHLLNKTNEDGDDELMVGISLDIIDPADPLMHLQVSQGDDQFRNLFDDFNLEKSSSWHQSSHQTFPFTIKKNILKKYKGFMGAYTSGDGDFNGIVFFLIRADRIIKKEKFADLAIVE